MPRCYAATLPQVEYCHLGTFGIFIQETLLKRIPIGSAQHEQGLLRLCRQFRQTQLVSACGIKLVAGLHRVPQLEHQPRLQLQRAVLPRLIGLLHSGGESFRVVRQRSERVRQLIEQRQQLLRHAPQVCLLEPLLFAQLLIQQRAALAIRNDGSVEYDALRPVSERGHLRQQQGGL